MNIKRYGKHFYEGLKTGCFGILLCYLMAQYLVDIHWPEHALAILFGYTVLVALWETVTLFDRYRDWRCRIVYSVGLVVLATLSALLLSSRPMPNRLIFAVSVSVVTCAVALPIAFFIIDRITDRQVAQINDRLEQINRK